MSKSTFNPPAARIPRPPLDHKPWEERVPVDDLPDTYLDHTGLDIEGNPLPPIRRNHHGGLARVHQLTPKVYKEIVEDMRCGIPFDVALNNAGISKALYSRWMKLCADPTTHPLYHYLRDDVRDARRIAMRERQDIINQATDWQAAKWSLEQMDHNYRSNRAQVESRVATELNSVLAAIAADLEGPDAPPWGAEAYMRILETISSVRGGTSLDKSFEGDDDDGVPLLDV